MSRFVVDVCHVMYVYCWRPDLLDAMYIWWNTVSFVITNECFLLCDGRVLYCMLNTHRF